MALSDTQLVQLLGERLPDNTSEEITPDDLRDVLLELVRAKVNLAQLQGYAQLASPAFTGVPQVPTAAAGTATNQVASTGFVQQALAFLAGSKNLSELLLPQAVVAGNWYLTLGGLWEPRRSFTAQADPTSGPNWRQVASFTGPAVTITADAITDASPAGRRLLTAASAAAQRALLGNPSIVANQYGEHPGWSAEDGPDGLFAWLIKGVLATKTVAPPEAPTNGQVNDVSKEFSFTVNPAYPSYIQYLAAGLPGSTGAVALSPANAYQVGSTVYLKVGSAVAKGNLAVYVSGSGTMPAGKVLTNGEAFTGAVTTPPTTVKATKPGFGPIDDNNNIVTLTSEYSYNEVRWGVEGQPAQPLGSNSICSPGNIAGRLYAYVVTDAAANRSMSETVYSDAFSVNATANNAPTVALTSPQDGQTLAINDPVVLNANPVDADGVQDIKRVDFYDNGVKFTEATGAPYTVQRNLSAGAHSFTSRVYDMVGASGLSNAVVVNAQAATTTPDKTAYILNIWGQSPASGLSPRTGLPAEYYTTRANIQSWDKTTGKTWPYSLGQINPNTGSPYTMQEAVAAGNPALGANDHGITKAIVPDYDNGFGPDAGILKALRADINQTNLDWFLYKQDLTPPVSTDGASMLAHFQGLAGRPPLYDAYLANKNAFKAYLLAQGYTKFVEVYVIAEGEQDSSDYLNTGNSGPNPNYQDALNSMRNRFIADGIATPTTKFIVNATQRALDTTIFNAEKAFALEHPGIIYFFVHSNPVFLQRDGTHDDQPTMLEIGAGDYALLVGTLASGTPYPVASNAQYPISAGSASYTGLLFADNTNLVQNAVNWAATGTLGFGNNLGLSDKYLPANTAGRIKLSLNGAQGQDAALLVLSSATKTSILAADYGFLILGAGNGPNQGQLSIYQGGTNPFGLLPTTAAYQYALARDAQMVVSVQESPDGNNWRIIAQFGSTNASALYVGADVNGGATLVVPQGAGLVARPQAPAGSYTDLTVSHTDFTYDNGWMVATGDANSLGGSIHYAPTFGLKATKTITFDKAVKLRYVAEKDTGLNRVQVDLLQNGASVKTYVLSQNGPATAASLTAPVFEAPDLVAAGTYQLVVQKADNNNDYIVLDTLVFRSPA